MHKLVPSEGHSPPGVFVARRHFFFSRVRCSTTVMAEHRMHLYKGREQRSQDGRRHARAEEGVQLRKDKREDQVSHTSHGHWEPCPKPRPLP